MDFELLYNNEHLFLRDDVASGIVIDEDWMSHFDGKDRFSVFSKHPYVRLRVYCMSKEQALIQFKKDYLDLLKEIDFYNEII